ncbi:MAG: PorT family protein [Flavobacteriales bacterium]|nr:PorT family protein [Flavobacteriales bacterium]MCB9449392.1 PorT family protein [Flavobacteriales bacterium]
MKKVCILLMMILPWMNSNAQESEKTSDTTTFKLGTMKILMVDQSAPDASNDTINGDNDNDNDGKEEKLAHWDGIDLGVNGFMNANHKTGMTGNLAPYELDYARSQVWNVNLFETKIKIVKEYVGIVTGLGLSFHGYAFKKNMNLVVNADSTFSVPDTTIDYNKNKLKVTYVQLPVLLEFNTSDDPKRTFHIAGGVLGGYKIGARLKQKYEVDGDKHVERVAGHYNLNPFQLSATVRVGYGKFTVFADYALTPLFEKNKGPELYAFSAGVTLVGF